MSFVQNFEKTASKPAASIGDALKYIGKSLYSGGKGAAKGVGDHMKNSAKKMKEEPAKFKKGWKGFKNPDSYEALAGSAVRFAPEIAAAGGASYLSRKYLTPEGYADTPIAYY